MMSEQELRIECVRLAAGSRKHAEDILAWVKGEPAKPVVQRVFAEGVHCSHCDGTGRAPLTKDDPLGQLPCVCNGTGLR